MAAPVTALLDLAEAVLDGIVAHWPAGAEALPTRRFVAPGEVAFDCCEQLAVQLERSYMTDGDAATEVPPQQVRYVYGRGVQMRVWLSREVHGLDDDGNAPTADELDTDGSMMMRDAQALWNALMAAYRAGSFYGCDAMVPGDYEMIGPEGRVSAGAQRVFLGLDGAPPGSAS